MNQLFTLSVTIERSSSSKSTKYDSAEKKKLIVPTRKFFPARELFRKHQSVQNKEKRKKKKPPT